MTDASTLFENLTARPRRRILMLLLESNTIQIEDVTHTRSGPQSTLQQRQERFKEKPKPTGTEIQLHHIHLPKLEENSLIEWDRHTNSISRGPRYVAIEPALEAIISNGSKFPPDLI